MSENNDNMIDIDVSINNFSLKEAYNYVATAKQKFIDATTQLNNLSDKLNNLITQLSDYKSRIENLEISIFGSKQT